MFSNHTLLRPYLLSLQVCPNLGAEGTTASRMCCHSYHQTHEETTFWGVEEHTQVTACDGTGPSRLCWSEEQSIGSMMLLGLPWAVTYQSEQREVIADEIGREHREAHSSLAASFPCGAEALNQVSRPSPQGRGDCFGCRDRG